MDKNQNKPKCSNCQSGWVYTKEDGVRVCRTCGHRETVTKPRVRQRKEYENRTKSFKR